MYLYWFILSFVSLLSLRPVKFEEKLNNIIKIYFLIFLSIFIGLRHEVGGDWDIYKYDFYRNVHFFNILNLQYIRDFGYELLSYATYKLELGIYGLNFALGIIFIFSLHTFALNFSKNYWLTFVIAFPYLITVVSMGFTRQGTALAFALLSLCAIRNLKSYKFIFYSIMAILFHKSVALLSILILLTHFKFKIKFILIFIILILSSFALILPDISRYVAGYLTEASQYKSKGVYFRMSLNLLSGLIFLFFYKKIKVDKNINLLIFLVFFINIILLFIIKDHSTFVDRIIIYFVFIQLIVFTRLELIAPRFEIFFTLTIIILYFAVYFVWFNYSIHSYAWMPYKNILIEVIK